MHHPNRRPSVVIFGAGSIGRSFIAPVFTRGGYKAVFVDVAPSVLKALEQCSGYDLVEKSDNGDTVHHIGPVCGLDARDADRVAKELERTELCVVCVGAEGLPHVLRQISRALGQDARQRKKPLDLILAENLAGADDMVRSVLMETGWTPAGIRERIGIVETSIGKMVPTVPADVASIDPLLCWAESYNTLIVDADGFLGDIPRIPDLKAVSPIAPWVERKLYIHNFGHAATAYLGYRAQPDAIYIRDVLENKDIFTSVEQAMILSGEALHRKYPHIFSRQKISNHIHNLLDRFRNRALGDTIYRVGRDLGRKLQKGDRIVGALSLVLSHGMDTDLHLNVFQSALHFQAPGPDGQVDPRDINVLAKADRPDMFLRDVVGISKEESPELYRCLAKAWDRP